MRPSTDEYFLNMARLVASRSTCISRAVGCVIVNRRSHVLATGYNGVAADFPHCKECNRLNQPGLNLEICPAIHAEANGLLQCNNVFEIEKIYCTDSPCIHCLKLLMNTSTKEIIFINDYPNSRLAKELWLKMNRVWRKYEIVEK